MASVWPFLSAFLARRVPNVSSRPPHAGARPNMGERPRKNRSDTMSPRSTTAQRPQKNQPLIVRARLSSKAPHRLPGALWAIRLGLARLPPRRRSKWLSERATAPAGATPRILRARVGVACSMAVKVAVRRLGEKRLADGLAASLIGLGLVVFCITPPPHETNPWRQSCRTLGAKSFT